MHSLASFVGSLKEEGSVFVKFTTPEELVSLQKPHDYTGLPVYRVVEVFLTQVDKQNRKPLYMIFVDNGAIYYCNGDILENSILDEPHFFMDNQYDLEAILSAYYLDSSSDLASFAGFFFL